MKFPLLSLRKEITDHLGPFLKELGIAPKLTMHSWGAEIEFKAPNGSFSNVRIQVSPETMAGGGWHKSTAFFANYEKIDLGHNGWTAHRVIPGDRFRMLPEDAVEAFRIIRSAMEEVGVVRVYGPDYPDYSFNEDLAEVYQELEETLDPNTRYYFNRNEGVESFSFQDEQDRSWCVRFEDNKAKLYIDGELQKSYPQHAFQAIAQYIKRRASSPDRTPRPRV